MKVAVYGICKNEELHVERWLESVGEADRIFVLDSGSEDRTLELLRAHEKVELHTANFVPFRFDIARNMILNQIPTDFDIAVFCDFDEVLEPGWRNKLEQVTPPYDALHFRMIFTRTASGEPDIIYNRVMAHRPQSYVWVYPVHEILVPQNPMYNLVLDTDITVEHLPDLNKPRSQYLDLLETGVEEFPYDPRMRQYLGREYMYREEWQRAILHFQKHVTMGTDSRLCVAESYRYIARCYRNMGHDTEAEKNFFRALATAPDQREALAELSIYYQQIGEVESCLAFALACARVPESDDYVIREHRFYREWPHHMAAWAFNQLGCNEQAQRQITMALTLSPNDPTIIADFVSLTGQLPSTLLEKINTGELSISYEESNGVARGGDQPETVLGAESQQAEEVPQTVSPIESPVSAGEGSREG